MGEWQRDLMLRGEADVPPEQVQRTSDEVGEAFQRIQAQLAACWGPEPMARVAT